MELDAQAVQLTLQRIAPYIRRTPMIPSPNGGFVKLESLQPTGSFKVRGFFAAALSRQPSELAQGLLTVSAGNAARACAHVARTLGVSCRVVMYDTAPAVKVEGVRALGAEIVAMPREQVHEWLLTRAWEREPEVFIHPFADETVMSGHGTLALEILGDLPDMERVLVPVGGGGLICGIAAAFKALRSQVRVVGVQSDGYPLWSQAFAAGGAISLTPDTIADGTTAPFDPLMFARLRELVGEWIVVPETAVRASVRDLATGMRVVAEGAGALTYTALNDIAAPERTVAVLSGGNIDPSRLAELLVG
jgi:threonine dehydratase